VSTYPGVRGYGSQRLFFESSHDRKADAVEVLYPKVSEPAIGSTRT
jgi:hypothetical protein